MPGKIFISYRRSDDAGFTHALYQRLENEFAAGDLFMDVEGQIRPGDDFVEVMNSQIAAADVVLVVIGPRWADLFASRWGDPNDYVAIEIKAALNQGKRVVPVLVGGAAVPRVDALPDAIRALARRNAVSLRPERFSADCQGLAKALKEQLSAAEQERAALLERQLQATSAQAADESDFAHHAQDMAAHRDPAIVSAPSTVTKTYPQRGSLQQIRFADPIAFNCFRCGEAKKSKLITVYGGNWSRRLCNGCYGRLLSLYDVKKGRASDDERADALAKALIASVADDDQREAQKLFRASEDRAINLSAEALRFIGTAEYVARSLEADPQLEWSRNRIFWVTTQHPSTDVAHAGADRLPRHSALSSAATCAAWCWRCRCPPRLLPSP